MINPLRSEAEAYRFVWLTVGYLGAIGLASWAGGKWAGLAVFIVLSALVLAVWIRARREEAVVPTRTVSKSGEGERRILVVANETVGGHMLLDEIRRHSEGVKEDILVVVPALNSAIRHWTSDEDGARTAAQERLNRSLGVLASEGIAARGEVGDSDPLQAMEDALRTWVDRIADANDTEPVYVYFNNDPGGAAIVDASAFADIARERGLPVSRTP